MISKMAKVFDKYILFIGWTTVSAPAHITECSGTKMFGGFGKFGARAVAMRTFELPPHHTVILKL